MNLESKIESAKKVLDENLKSIEDENKKYTLKVKSEYQRKLKSIVEIDGVKYTVEKAYLKALEERKSLIISLTNEQNSKKQMIILDELKKINEIIDAYDEFTLREGNISKLSNEYKENNKFKKASYVASCIDQIISYIDEEINKIKEELKSQKKISEINNKEELDKIYALSSNIINFSNLKSSLKGLLKYNGTNISSSKDIKKLTNNLDTYGCKIVNTLYNLIFYHNLNMNMVNVVIYDDLKDEKDITEDEITPVEAEPVKVKPENVIVKPVEVEPIKAKPENVIVKPVEVEPIKAEPEDIIVKPVEVEPVEGKQKTDLNEDNFKDLIYKLKTAKTISSDDIYKLYNGYNSLSKELSDYYEEDYNKVVGLYNSQQQNKYQNRLDKNDFKKYSFTEKVTEFFGKPYQLIVTMKKSKLKRLAKKLDQEDITSEEKLDVRDEIEKINNEISASDVISSVKLFNAKNKLSDMKLKLYKGEQLDYSKVTNTISKVLGKGLSKKKDDLDILNNKSRAITVMDQYVELVASGSFSKEDIDAAYAYLEKIGSLLTNSEYNGYLEELNLIYYYRSLNKIPYHLNQIGNKTEVDDLIKYYDSEEYSKLLNKNASYIKGK